jgi:asparagine synthase (glutamine-hydrolysing)
MCGVIGIVTTRHRNDIIKALTQGVRAMEHRGPDDEGLELISQTDNGLTVGFAHRRLSILDLSPAGHQPMKDEMTGNWITFNGEVFNFQEIRRRLKSEGIGFRSGSDTEVLLKGLSRQGLSAVADWRGMFALGFWEPESQRLTLIRDRLGIKPLYYYRKDDLFVFASEVRALLRTRLVPRRLSPVAVESYLAYGAVQQPLTMIENVYAVMPGQALILENEKLRTEQYWQLKTDHPQTVISDRRVLVEEIGELLTEAVRLRMVADVPVAAFLSGGIDSSAVVSLMRRVTNGTIKTFSVCFDEREFTEEAYAERIAGKFGTEHHPVLLTEQSVLSKIPLALDAMDQPSVDGVNTYVVSEAVAQAGLKVALSGLGGDEVFAGYSFFRTVERDERRQQLVRRVPRSVRQTVATAINALGRTNRSAKLSSVLRGDLQEHSVLLHRRLFTTEQQHTLLERAWFRQHPALDRELLSRHEAQQRVTWLQTDPVNQASLIDLGGYLSNMLLRDTDAMSMAHSLEVRVPLIDHLLIERMLRIPGPLKISGSVPKWLLVEAVGDLPETIVNRPKCGFELPFSQWLKGALREQVEAALQVPGLEELLQSRTVRALWQAFMDDRISWSRVWSLYVLGSWLKLNMDEDNA